MRMRGDCKRSEKAGRLLEGRRLLVLSRRTGKKHKSARVRARGYESKLIGISLFNLSKSARTGCLS